MQTSTKDLCLPTLFALGARLALMAAIIAALVAGSSWTRRLPPSQSLTIWVNLFFFVALGSADELVLAPVLDGLPLGRAAAMVAETLVLGWFFSPGREKPASKLLFFVHLGPFFLAVFGGALCALLVRRLRADLA